jgi:aldehyde dehydrogenase (NAD+)
VNPFQDVFDAQKALFATGVTRTYDWRVDQLDRMARMIGENEHRFQKAIAHDFKTASFEYVMETASAIDEAAFQKNNIKEWMEPVEAPVPRSLRASGHKAFVHRDPYGVALIMGPFNGPFTLMIRPALAALTAGNTCILKVHRELTATSPLLRELVPHYFDPAAVTTAPGDIPSTTEILKLPFDFIFFTGSTKVGKIVARSAAEHPALVDEKANIPLAAKGSPGVCVSGLRVRPRVGRRRSSSPKPKRRSSRFTAMIPRATRTTPASSVRKPSIGSPG